MVVSLSNSSPEFNRIIGPRSLKRWSDKFNEAMDKYRSKYQKRQKKKKSLILNFTPVRNDLEKQYKQAKKFYEQELKRYNKKMKETLSTNQKNIAQKKGEDASLKYKEANMDYLIVALQTLMPTREPIH